MSNETEKGTFAVKAGLAQVRNNILYRFRASSRRARGRDRVDGRVHAARWACTRLGAYVDGARQLWRRVDASRFGRPDARGRGKNGYIFIQRARSMIARRPASRRGAGSARGLTFQSCRALLLYTSRCLATLD